MISRLRSALFVAAALLGAVQTASAQNCGTGKCGPAVGNSYSGRSECGHFGLKLYPRSELHYIKQFCGPHIVPGSCFGYFKPQITPWGQACPMYGDAVAEAMNSGPRTYTPAATTPETPPSNNPSGPTPKLPEPKTLPKDPMTPKIPDMLPKSNDTFPKIPDVIPSKPPVIPVKPPTATPMVPKLEGTPSISAPPSSLPPIPESPIKF
ncbi:MAG: hypothetical protein ACRC8S_13110 [Fimbriiglobus sp.]